MKLSKAGQVLKGPFFPNKRSKRARVLFVAATRSVPTSSAEKF